MIIGTLAPYAIAIVYAVTVALTSRTVGARRWVVYFLLLSAVAFHLQLLTTVAESFPTLVLLLLTGALSFQHALVWSQDELYYGYLALGMSYACLRRGSLTMAGALLEG